MNTHIETARSYLQANFGSLPQPKKSFILFSGPRSGSNLLLRHLELIGYGRPIEAFHWSHDRLRREQGWDINFDDPFEYITHAVNFQTVNNICGVKFGWQHFGYFLSLAQKLLVDFGESLTNWEMTEVFFPNPSYLHLIRKDKVDQAISLSKSKQTGIWYIPTTDDGQYKNYVVPPVYDRQHIEYCFGQVLATDLQWKSVLGMDQIPHHSIYYEDYINNVEGEFRKVYQYLGGKGELDVPELPLNKLANKKSEGWRKRFIKESSWINSSLVKKAMATQNFQLLLSCFAYQQNKNAEQLHYEHMAAIRFKRLRQIFCSIKRKFGLLEKQDNSHTDDSP